LNKDAVVKSNMDSSVEFTSRRQCTPPCYRCPPSPQPNLHLGWFSRFCTAHGRQSLYFTVGHPLSSQHCMGDLYPI